MLTIALVFFGILLILLLYGLSGAIKDFREFRRICEEAGGLTPADIARYHQLHDNVLFFRGLSAFFFIVFALLLFVYTGQLTDVL